MVEDKRYLLGLDAGNTVIKAVLFDLEGRQLAMYALDGQSSTPHPGHVERDLDELWANAREAIGACIERAGIDPRHIAGIGCAGHGNGLYLLDKADRPLAGIQSLDTRAAPLAASLAAANGDALHAICLQKPWPSQTPTLLAWVKANAHDIYARAGSLMLCKDFITFRLTGERVSEISDMSGCGLLRMPECVYDDDLLSLYGLEDAKSLLPRLIDPAEVAGTVSAKAAAETGLAEGTPVIGGYFDVVASAMGAGAVSSGEASIIAGTWSINQVFSDKPVVDPNVFMVAGFSPGRFVNVESSATSAANLEWYVREFVERGGHHDDPFGQCNALVGSVTSAADDPLFHPFLYGSGQGADFRAGFYGVAGWHGEGHLLRALFEGVMFEHRRHIEVLASAGVAFDRAVMSGGGSRSPYWPQIFADGLGVPITVAEARETGALGAAIGAGVGAGLFADYETGIAAMARPGAEFAPDLAMRHHYDRRYRIYSGLAETLKEFWATLPNDTMEEQ
ncbi:FGGY-family carbohydrate kinase [Chelativorans salis]|uniref:Carbohydrate kinase n=1 Tax=Chelativorans salis TaxID=2978478 RepID=A0ABT2LLE1_9HYPH|nr:FGGY-family carbohydrate kinase [Chelativorans sp. EGI FJ00035]MCT7374637.1 carbohydrate kinase [Chelativorans sp. EGI FJ00035]